MIMTLGTGWAIAQDVEIEDVLPETWVSEYGYQFSYPADWVAEDNPGETEFDDGSLLLDDSGDIIVLFFEPQPLEIVGRGDTIEEVMANRWADFITSDVQVLEDLNQRRIAIADIAFEGSPGLGIMVEFDNDTYGLVAGYDFGSNAATLDEDNTILLYLIASTFDVASSSGPGSKDDPGGTTPGVPGLPRTLENHDADDWRNAIAELQDIGLIGTGGTLVFNERTAFFNGQGSFYTPLARNSPFRDIVMAAEIDYTASNALELETCAIMAGVQTNGGSTTNTYLEIGFTNAQDFYVLDLVNGEAMTIEVLQENVNLNVPHHVLAVIQDGLITVYLDGELIADAIPMEERAGTYGIALSGKGVGASCRGNNIWVYQVPSVTPGLCEVTSGNTVNKRSGPGTNFAQAGQFTAGSVQEVIGQNSDGSFTWWKLDDDTWVREDVVSVQGDCADIPIAK
jgi:hypothetical protein